MSTEDNKISLCRLLGLSSSNRGVGRITSFWVIKHNHSTLQKQIVIGGMRGGGGV